MNWNYLLPRFALAAIVWFFFAFAFDPMIRNGLVSMGQTVTGAKVELSHLQTGFFPPSFKAGPINVASRSNKKRNLVSIDQIEMKLAGKPLLHRNFIVEEAVVSGIEFDVPRSTSGQISENSSQKQKTGFQFDTQPFRQKSKELGKSWLMSLTDSAKEQLDPDRLETVRVSKTVQLEWKQRFAQYETRLEQIKHEIDSVQNTVKTAEGKTINKIKTYAQSAERVDQLIRDGKQIRSEMKSLPQIAQQDYRRIEEAKERDLAQIDQILESISPDPQNILHAVIGEELSQQLEQVFGWSKTVFQTVSTLQDEREPERIQGEWIDFRRNSHLPGLLFQKVRLSGKARVNKQKYPFTGIIKELSSSPAQYQKPIAIQAQVDAETQIKLAGELKYYEDSPTHDLIVLLTLPHQKKLTLENSDDFSLDLIADHTECKTKITFRENDFQCRLELNQTPARFQFSAPENGEKELAGILTRALSSVDSISATLICSGPYAKPKFTVESELGQQIAQGLNLAFEAEFVRHKQAMTVKIEQLASQQREKLIQQLNGQYSEIIARLNEQESKVQAVIQKVSNRPLNIRRLLR